ncbi:ABC transporter substrate-binding protein [Rhodomicrobium sp. Az07]|uniref:heme/hemin ABC transporter substrate-binding protein n=1 Tax=Rhodomicrobium sp. Az07 TaxID=2839034 RepID=UPI001BEA426F|nr:ABC transporter substrate-binding protein [Rhodomicrobium sp. Az07]MBT3070576.1 ABC transporter substrate-binding protein [Rhodomicrobium sp. Az07]
MAAFVLATLPAARAAESGKRVVTVGGDVTEIVFALGEGERVVGRDTTSTFPPEAGRVPDVGYMRQLGAEGVLSLRPDVVIASAGAGPAEVLKQIESAGVRVVRVPDPHSVDGLIQKVTAIADALDAKAAGAALTAKLQQDLTKARSEVAGMPGHPRVLFIITAGSGPPMAAGTGTAADALIKLAGGENVFAAHTGYKPISLEAAAAASPEAIGLMDQTLREMGGVDAVASNAALRLTPAAKEKRIFGREGSYLLSFGPRLPQALSDFAHAIREKAAEKGAL